MCVCVRVCVNLGIKHDQKKSGVNNSTYDFKESATAQVYGFQYVGLYFFSVSFSSIDFLWISPAVVTVWHDPPMHVESPVDIPGKFADGRAIA